ncbi:unnamed protein product [Rotaria socialis]|uniref:Uncharacterized protein n=2 Tax=Rotaria socialis TaxID=392032 RepID=A0A821TX81_9BILA|nr:unnamed protein product [Rotaria socialis]
MPTSTQAVAPYAPRFCQVLAQETNGVSHTPTQSTVREVQWNMADVPSASSLGSVPTTSWKPLIVVLTAVILVAAVAAVAAPFLIAYFRTETTTTSTTSTTTTATTTTTTTTTTTATTSTTTTTTTTRLYFELLRGKKHERLSAALDLDELEFKISPYAANLPAACSSYTTISDATRSVTYTTFVGCDSSSFSSSGQWVRFTGSGGTTIPTYAPGTSVCGTSATGWYASALPSSGATVSGTLCYDWSNTCTWSTSIQVANCNTYYVYLLYPSPVCNLRVCTV